MGHIWLPRVRTQIVLNGKTYSQNAFSIINRRKENGFDTATLFFEDAFARNFSNIGKDDAVEIKEKDESNTSWETILKGITRRVIPITNSKGNFLKVECDGAGYGLSQMNVAEEYGDDTTNDVKTIATIIDDATTGIIPRYVNKILGSMTASGHNYSTVLEAITGNIPYIYFPYKPADKAIQDLCDVVQAIKGAAAGPHWIVDTDDRVLLATIGAHPAAPVDVAQYWPTWWRTDQAGSTLVEGHDFEQLQLFDLAKEANYVLYHSKFIRPATGDFWTENQKALWGVSNPALTLNDDNAVYKVGLYSLRGDTTQSGGSLSAFYPSSGTWNLDVTKLGGEHNIPTLNFFLRKGNADVTSMDVVIWTNGGVTGCYRNLTLTDATWCGFSFPIGEYAYTAESGDPWTYSGAIDWTDVDSIRFQGNYAVNANNKQFWVDGVNISGYVLRAAKQSAAYSSADKCKMQVVTDHVGKDDSLIESDDTGLIGRLAYAQYLRSSNPSMVGSITIPIARDLLPGQLIHLKARKTRGSTYKIDKDFRVTRFSHAMAGKGLTNVEVTDDLYNANPRLIPTEYNALFGIARPAFQDRQATSIKTREIDITQVVMVNTY